MYERDRPLGRRNVQVADYGGDLSGILHRMQSAGNLELAAVVSMDGFLIQAAAADGSTVNRDEFAAVATNGVMVAQALGHELQRGGIEDAFFEYEQGTVIVAVLDPDLALILLSYGNANLGLLRLLVRRHRAALVTAAGAIA